MAGADADIVSCRLLFAGAAAHIPLFTWYQHCLQCNLWYKCKLNNALLYWYTYVLYLYWLHSPTCLPYSCKTNLLTQCLMLILTNLAPKHYTVLNKWCRHCCNDVVSNVNRLKSDQSVMSKQYEYFQSLKSELILPQTRSRAQAHKVYNM